MSGVMLKDRYKIVLSLLFLLCFSSTWSQSLPTYSCVWTDLAFPAGSVSALYYDKQTDEVYYVGVGVISKINSNATQWTQIGTDPNNAIWPNAKIISMLIDNSGVFYVGCDATTNSWISFDRGTKWQRIADPLFMKIDSVNNVAVNTIYAHTDGTVYFGTDNGLIKTTDHGITFQKVDVPYSYITAILIDQSNNFFIGTIGGLFRSKDQMKSWTRMGLRFEGDNIHSVVQSKGSIYVTSHDDISISYDEGDTWINQRPKFGLGFSPNYRLYPFVAALDKNDNVFVCISHMSGIEGICFTDDNGEHWKLVATHAPPYSSANITVQPQTLCIDSKNLIYIISHNYPLNLAFRGERSTTGVEEENKLTIPRDYSLSQNYPNPFNPATKIKFGLPENAFIRMIMYDLLGREVSVLTEGELNAGFHEVEFNAGNLSSGIYFYKISTPKFTSVKKLILMK